ncbi:MAG: hypothetical protein H7Z17_03835 [Fuerstia sp.]|nr:hypothetical protein [Fuerstiella sp.]
MVDHRPIDPRELLPRALIAGAGDPNQRGVSSIWNVIHRPSSDLRTQVGDYSDMLTADFLVPGVNFETSAAQRHAVEATLAIVAKGKWQMPKIPRSFSEISIDI